MVSNGGNGPLKVTLGRAQAGAGAFIQADGPSEFFAQIEAFNSAGVSLGKFTEESEETGRAIYIGVLDHSGPNISSIVFSLVQAEGPTSDFALDSLFLSGPVVRRPDGTHTDRDDHSD